MREKKKRFDPYIWPLPTYMNTGKKIWLADLYDSLENNYFQCQGRR